MFYLIIIIWVILDLFTKNLAFKYLQDQVNIFWDYFYLAYHENAGIAFSIDLPFIKIFTIILIIAIFIYYFYEKKNINLEKINIWKINIENKKLLDLSFWLILAWAIWNWIERIFNEKVIDFIWVKYFSVFNLADSFITIWAIIYLYILLKNKK